MRAMRITSAKWWWWFRINDGSIRIFENWQFQQAAQLQKRRKCISFFDAFSIFVIYTLNNSEFRCDCACACGRLEWLSERLRHAVILCECAECANDLCVTTVRVHRNHKSFERLIICLFGFACHPFQVNIAFRESWQDEKFILTNKFWILFSSSVLFQCRSNV